MRTKRGKPFFYQASTQRWIKRLSQADELSIYAGAGVSIDRTGLSWSRLSTELLSATFDLSELTPELEHSVGVQRLASIAVERLKAIHADSTPNRVAEALRPILYEDSSWVSGMLIAHLGSLARSRAEVGRTTEILTTNYDDYIEAPFAKDEMNVVVSGVPQGEYSSEAFSAIRYLHGRIPERGSATPVVVSEAEYSETEQRVFEELMSAMDRRYFLILGSSLTDPPLIRALLASKAEAKKAGRQRLVLIPRQNNLAASTSTGRQLLRDALDHLGCTAVYPDFYCQVAQFICEVRVCSWDPAEYSQQVSPTNYEGRLNGWWNAWMQEMQNDLSDQQALHYRRLQALLKDAQGMLDAPEEESLKLELWMRWRPDERRLRLWASSVGNWHDESSMRYGRIASDSQYVSVRAFCDGHPILESVPESSNERWRTYLAAPVWIHDKSNREASHIAGVITLASMYSGRSSSVSRRNRAKLRRALTHLSAAASAMLSADTARMASDDVRLS